MKARIPVLLLAVAAASCGYKPAREASWASLPAYAFPHSTHVDADVACANCHDMTKATALDASVRHVRIPADVPKQKACGDCHDSQPKFQVPARDRPYHVRINHAEHLSRVNGDCKRCHQKLTEVGDKQAATPKMAACTSCHAHQKAFAEARCMPCHVDLKDYKPETAFKHEGNWLAMHGQLAHSSGESCAQCHDQTFCTGCHSPQTAALRLEKIFPERVDRAFIHRGDYVSRHMVDAGANPASCRTCHGTPFCDSCHTANGFSPAAAAGTRIKPVSHSANGFSASSPGAKIRPLSHGAGWVNNVDGGAHKREARRDVSACASCHDQRGPQNVCTTCHAGGSGRNPHPKSFLDSHKLSDVSKNGMCRDCHR